MPTLKMLKAISKIDEIIKKEEKLPHKISLGKCNLSNDERYALYKYYDSIGYYIIWIDDILYIYDQE